ncbi:MAG: glycosyltransferase [Bacteroidaceae bacterium]|nr:glycosyltransferase [Bacteroidaceae bacterium]
MHILEIPSFFPPYGGLFCLDQAKALKALGHEVRILSNVQLGATIGLRDYVVQPYLRYEHELDGITVCQSFQRGLPKCIRYNVRRWVRIVQSMFADYVRKYGQPDILHAHCCKWAGYAAMQISRLYHIPYVITEHLPLMLLEEEYGKAPSTAWQIPLLKRAYKQAAMVLPVSEELVDDIACYYGKDYRWQYMSNTIDTDFFAYQSRPSREGRPFRFCCLADYYYRKGYDVLFEAYRSLQHLGLNVELHVAGLFTDGADCRKAIVDRQLTGVYTYGRVDKHQVRKLLYQSDALVLASRSEVQPLVLLEAMSTGLPVVATECIPQSLRIEPGCTIVPVDDVLALSEAMRTVSQCDGFDGKTVSEKVRQIASPEVIGQKLAALFSDILASR